MARSDEDQTDFLRKRGFSKGETAKVTDTVLAEEARTRRDPFSPAPAKSLEAARRLWALSKSIGGTVAET